MKFNVQIYKAQNPLDKAWVKSLGEDDVSDAIRAFMRLSMYVDMPRGFSVSLNFPNGECAYRVTRLPDDSETDITVTDEGD
jgi:hypothetical protein